MSKGFEFVDYRPTRQDIRRRSSGDPECVRTTEGGRVQTNGDAFGSVVKPPRSCRADPPKWSSFAALACSSAVARVPGSIAGRTV